MYTVIYIQIYSSLHSGLNRHGLHRDFHSGLYIYTVVDTFTQRFIHLHRGFHSGLYSRSQVSNHN